jgi:ParB/RepB/Spo0J family partition protein
MLPTVDLYVPDWNPRKYIDEGEMQKLVAYRKNGGQVSPIWVWKGAGQAPWAIISGQRRWIADARLGKTHIAAIILDITLEEAMILAYASNTDSKPHWLESVTTIERLYKAQTKKSQDKLGAALGGVSGARVNLALKLAKGLNPASRDSSLTG